MIFRKKIVISLHVSRNFLQIVCFSYIANSWSFICAEQIELDHFQIDEDIKKLFQQADIICSVLDVQKENVEMVPLIQKKADQTTLWAYLERLIPFKREQVIIGFDARLVPTPIHIALKKDIKELIGKLTNLYKKPNFIFSPSRCLHQFLLQVCQLQEGNCLYIEENKAAFLTLKSQVLCFYASFNFENIFIFKQKIKVIFDEITAPEIILIGPDYKNKNIKEALQELGREIRRPKMKSLGEVGPASVFALAIGCGIELCSNNKWVYFNQEEFADTTMFKRFQKQLFTCSIALIALVASCFCFINATIYQFEKHTIASIESSLEHLGIKTKTIKPSFWSNAALIESAYHLQKWERKIPKPKITLLPTPVHALQLVEADQNVRYFQYLVQNKQVHLVLRGVDQKGIAQQRIPQVFSNLRVNLQQESEQLHINMWMSDE